MTHAALRAGSQSLKLRRIGWCLIDFANSSFPTIVITAFGAPYFTGVIAEGKPVQLGPVALAPNAAWGVAIAISMLLVTLSAPIWGAVADRFGNRDRLLTLHVALTIGASLGLAFVKPGDAALAWALVLVANYAFEASYVFYNAYLPELGAPSELGRISGYAWGFGYVGGLLSLALSFPFLPKAYTPEHATNAGWVFVIVAGWYALFAGPALLLVRDRNARVVGKSRPTTTLAGDIGTTLSELRATFREARATHWALLFLVAYLLYTDAVTTVIDFTGIFTKDVLQFTPKDNIILFLVLNVIALPGSLAMGHLADRYGARRTLRVAMVAWVVVVAIISTATTRATFWVAAFGAAVLIGGTQACSRTYMAQRAPAERATQYMGLLALSGKTSGVFGPAVYGLLSSGLARVTDPTMGHRIAVAFLGMLFAISFALLGRLKGTGSPGEPP